MDRLVERLGAREDAESRRVLGFVFDALCNVGRAATVLRWRRTHPEAARTNVDLWLAVGRAYLLAERTDKVVEWFQGWREREGVEMWGVSNYVSALWDRKQWDRCQDEARYVLEHVAPDSTLPQLATKLVEAGLMVATCTPDQDFSAFIEDYDRWAPVLELPAEGRHEWQRQVCGCLRVLVGSTDPAHMRPPATRLRSLCDGLGLDQDWRIGVARTYLRHHLSWWQRLWIRV